MSYGSSTVTLTMNGMQDPLTFLASRQQQQQQQQHSSLSINGHQQSPLSSPAPSSSSSSSSSSSLSLDVSSYHRRPIHQPHQPLPPAPQPLPIIPPLEDVSSLSRGSYGSFSAPRCPLLVTRIALPVFWLMALFALVSIGVNLSRCDEYDASGVTESIGWCCSGINSFTRSLSVATFAIHTAMLTWLLQLYHTKHIACFPSQSRTLVMVAFAFRASFLILMWMLYFLLFSLSLISTLPEQVTCSSTGADRALFYPTAIFNIVCCLLMKVMLGLMGKSVWKYWELRHLTPAELMHYEQQRAANRHFGLTREQVDVLLKVTLTCSNTVTIGPVCGTCGDRQVIEPPSLTAVLAAAIKPKIQKAREAFAQRQRQRRGRRNNENGENGSALIDNEEREQSDYSEPSESSDGLGGYVPPSLRSADSENNRPSSPSPIAPGGAAFVAFPPSLLESGRSVSSDADSRSQSTLMPLGGVPSMTCGICLDDYRHHDRVMILPCRHHGHIDCLMPWLNGHRSCPTCRASVVHPKVDRGIGN